MIYVKHSANCSNQGENLYSRIIKSVLCLWILVVGCVVIGIGMAVVVAVVVVTVAAVVVLVVVAAALWLDPFP